MWDWAQHLVLTFPMASKGLRLLGEYAKDEGWLPTRNDADKPAVQVSLGFSRRGLERIGVPAYVLTCFALRAQAFTAGAALRASPQLAASGMNVPEHWVEAFHHCNLHAVISLHSNEPDALEKLRGRIWEHAEDLGISLRALPLAHRLSTRPGGQHVASQHVASEAAARDEHQKAQWTHFGFRDGLSRIGIEGWTRQRDLESLKPTSIHRAGEFLLGHPQDSGANPWIAGPGASVWPGEMRAFFRDGSFGVLLQMQQFVEPFEAFVDDETRKLRRLEIPDERTHPPTLDELAKRTNDLKGKLCGRYPEGRVLAATQRSPGDDFDFADDPIGAHCPFGSHIRRMNPREPPGDTELPNAVRRRPLLRRGLPYQTTQACGNVERGLMGHFFCASVEDQFEHLFGQWGERVPLGSPDRGGARDPLIGAHDTRDGPYEIPQEKPAASIMLDGMTPFVRTRGAAYLFYPSVPVVQGIAKSDLWLSDDETDT